MPSGSPVRDLHVTYSDVEAAAERIAGVARRTPIHTSRTLDERLGVQCFFKCENFQRTGAFKFRGAYNAVSLLSKEEKRRGVLTYSSGNHAQALALAGRILNVRTTVVMPSDAPRVKLEATRGYGAEIITYEREGATREEVAAAISSERRLPIVPPYDHPHVVAGQGTAARELIEDAGPLDLLLVCCGGGGLLSGSALAARSLLPRCRVVGVEPARADDAARSFHSGELHTVHNPDTVADGARTPYLGEVTFPLVLDLVDEMLTVSEDAIVRAMHFFWQRMKLVVEPTGALAAAVFFEPGIGAQTAARIAGFEHHRADVLPSPPPRVGVILSGGNVQIRAATRLFRSFGLE